MAVKGHLKSAPFTLLVSELSLPVCKLILAWIRLLYIGLRLLLENSAEKTATQVQQRNETERIKVYRSLKDSLVQKRNIKNVEHLTEQSSKNEELLHV